MNAHWLDYLVSPPWWAALLAAVLFSVLARALRLLTLSGAIAAMLVGYIVLGLGGGKFMVPLLAFFISASLFSRIGRSRKACHARAAKGATRDWAQVAANGGSAALIVVLFRIVVFHWPIEQTRYLLMLYLAALATANADTWATEIGGLSGSPPRLLHNWKAALPGASGAITLLGIAAALAGSIAVTFTGWIVWGMSAPECLAVFWSGFLGSCLDSILGAGVQAVYRHPVTGELAEQPVIDGVQYVRIRGFAWINNDGVNLLASLGGIGCAWILLHYCAYAFN